MKNKLDLLGQQYGKLTVIAPAENLGSRTAWRCRCRCGRERIVKTSSLRGAKVRDCGLQCDQPNPLPNPRGLDCLTYVDGTCVEMVRASTIRKNNTSGVPGVDWVASKRRWRATICFQGKRHYLGCFARLEDAALARKRAEEQLLEPFLALFEDPAPDSPDADRA